MLQPEASVRRAARPSRPAIPLAALLACAVAAAAHAAETPTRSAVEETVQVTATRLPEDVLDVPASVTVIPGDELAARGVVDLAGALAFAGGVSIAPGGEGGPASAVPELMGLREFDAFLLVVDGVPWGGAFNPDLATLDLTNVDRIEVLRGAAPVLYGATSFVGVIHVIHRAPGDAARRAEAGGGTFGSWDAGLSLGLPGTDTFRSSVSASYTSRGFRDDRTAFDRAHARWDGAFDAGASRFRLWLDVTEVGQDPASPHPREGTELSPLVPLDANHNPSDAKIDETRVQLTLGWERPAGNGTWAATLGLTHTDRDTVRGFLREMFDVPPGTSNADGYRQEFSGDDVYLDAHWAWRQGSDLSVVAGVDLLAGKGTADSENFEYHVALDGADAPSSRDQTIDERPEFEDERTFGGAYALALWTPAPRWRVDAGVRLNVTKEKQEGEVEENGTDVRAEDERSDTRGSGSLGASFRAWQGSAGSLWVYASYTDAFKPAAVDFGPEAEGEILDPETAQTAEIGVKGTHADGRFAWQGSAYRMDFDNLVIRRTVNGLPSLTNAGQQRFEGVELEGSWHAADAVDVHASFALHAAEFRDYVAEFDGTPTQLAGNSLELSADKLGALGVTWRPAHGWFAGAGLSYVGERWLDKRNRALADPFTTVFAGVGYRFERFEVRVDGANLTDERDPVSESELGDAQYYRMPARSYRASVIWHL